MASACKYRQETIRAVTIAMNKAELAQIVSEEPLNWLAQAPVPSIKSKNRHA